MLRIDMDTLPQVHVMGQVRQPIGWKSVDRRAQQNMLILVREGDMKFEIGERRYSLVGGDFLFLVAGEKYKAHSDTSCQYVFIHFTQNAQRVSNEDALAELERTRRKFEQMRGTIPYSMPAGARRCIFVPIQGNYAHARDKISLMMTECDVCRYELNPGSKLRIELITAQMLGLLAAQASSSHSSAYPTALSRILLYIHEHYMSPVTLADLSEEFQLSRQYIMRLFQKYLGTTVTHYIQQLKLTHAQELLRYSTFRVNEVAEMLGFDNAYYFCRLFKRQFQMTPTEFIRKALDTD